MTFFGKRVAIALVFALMPAGAALADAGGKVEIRQHPIAGTTPKELVASMQSHPLHGGDGAAVATIRADQKLNVSTRLQGSRCIATSVKVQSRFVMTLPRAVQAGAMTPQARSAWAEFATFARRHEEGHKTIATQCARRFEAEVRGLASDEGCPALEARLAQLFAQSNAACARLQAAHDEADAPRLRALTLMRAAQ